jgi:hypothetical protein
MAYNNKGGMSNALKKNPDEAARNADAVPYEKSLEGGPPNSEYVGRSETTGPVNVLTSKKAPRNPK